MVPHCGLHCNKTIIIDPTSVDEVYYWASVGWCLKEYNDGCVCVLNVQVILSMFYQYLNGN